MAEEDPLSTENFHRITVIEERICSPATFARHFTFEPPGMFDREYIDPYNPEVGLKPRRVSMWQVLLGDKGMWVCEHKTEKLNKALFERPNFTEMFKDFEGVKAQMLEQEVEPPGPVLCWIRGLIHAFMVENPNRIEVTAVMHATSSNRR